MSDKTLIELVNPIFTLKLGDKELKVRKASIEQISQYQLKYDELEKIDMPSSVKDLELVAYCVYLIASKADSSITIDFVKDNIPGNTDSLQILTDLGFIDPQKIKMLHQLQEKLIMESSSTQLLKEQDGLQEKSQN